MSAPNLAGDTADQERLWRTYLYWAREAIDPSTATADLEIAPGSSRLSQRQQQKLKAILFAANALEYRLKRSLEAVRVLPPKRLTLGPLVDQFKALVEKGQRLDGGGKVQMPAAWDRVKRRLQRLVTDRNKIVHGHHLVVLTKLNDRGYSKRRLYGHFNALVEAMALINFAFGRGGDSLPAERKRLSPVSVGPRLRRLTTA